MRAALLTICLCATAWAKSAPAPAPEQQARFFTEGTRLGLAVDYPELIDAALQRRLDSGLATTVVVRAYLVREGSAGAEALAVQTVRTAYDLWDEVYVTEITDEAGPRVVRDKSRDQAARRLSALRLPLVERARLAASERYRVALIVELNPVSPALLAQVRKWLSRPREGGSLDPGGGDSYFGSFVSLFVNRKVGEAERVLHFRTQPFSTGELP